MSTGTELLHRVRRKSRRLARAALNKVHELTAPPAPRTRTGRTEKVTASAPKAPPAANQVTAPEHTSSVDYEGAWDTYATTWRKRFPGAEHIGDEWQGQEAGAAANIAEYVRVIEDKFITPYIESGDTVVEIGVGGGRTAKILRDHAAEVICADISQQMLDATQARLGDDRISYVKLDGRSLSGIEPGTVDVVFCFDTLVHVEPRDIFNYLVKIPPLLRGRRLVLLHHGNMLTERGWKRFVREYSHNLMGRTGSAFSVMTDSIMERFLDHLNYEVLVKDTETVPRDCVWVVRAPEAG